MEQMGGAPQERGSNITNICRGVLGWRVACGNTITHGARAPTPLHPRSASRAATCHRWQRGCRGCGWRCGWGARGSAMGYLYRGSREGSVRHAHWLRRLVGTVESWCVTRRWRGRRRGFPPLTRQRRRPVLDRLELGLSGPWRRTMGEAAIVSISHIRTGSSAERNWHGRIGTGSSAERNRHGRIGTGSSAERNRHGRIGTDSSAERNRHGRIGTGSSAEWNRHGHIGTG
jgi:hypothetical protein